MNKIERVINYIGENNMEYIRLHLFLHIYFIVKRMSEAISNHLSYYNNCILEN